MSQNPLGNNIRNSNLGVDVAKLGMMGRKYLLKSYLSRRREEQRKGGTKAEKKDSQEKR